MDTRLRVFYDFLTDRKVKKGEPITHTAKKSHYEDWFPASYFIEDEDVEEFWSKYCDLVRNEVYLTLTEKPEKFGPLRIDADFEASIEVGNKRQYTKQTLKKFVKIYQEEIKDIVDPEEFEDRMLWCIVLEKEAPRIKNEVIMKDGFHVHFPHFICDSWVQDIYLRNKVTSRMANECVWKGCEFITPYTEIIDRNMFNKPWMLYGSMNYKGNSDDSPYMYLPKKGQGIIYNHKQKQISLRDLFSEEMIGRNRSTTYYLPELLSIRGFYEKVSLNQEKMQKVKDYQRKKKPIVKKTKSEVEIKEILREIKDKELLEMLSYERKQNYEDWIRVGWALFNEAQGDEEALEMWKEFSLCDKYIEGDCEDHWSKMEMKEVGGYTMGSLCFWAKHDSPERFKEIKYHSIKKLCQECLYPQTANEYDVAMVVCEKYRFRFKCAGAKKGLWYEFKNHRWVEIDGELPLRELLPTEIAGEFFNLRKEYNGSEDTSDEVKGKRCYEIINKLKTDAFQTKVVNQCKFKFYDGEFLKKIDENKLLIGCENGVLDLKLGKFRPGDPGDYITFTNKNFYDDTIKPGSQEDQEVEEYLQKIFPNPNLRNYFLDFMCSCFRGGNIHKTFLIKTGDGNNGKSIMVKLLELVFGDYCGKFPRELLVKGRKNSSGSARPELARIRGKRIMFCQEIGNSVDEVDIGVLKELTGNDSFFTRSLFEKGTEITPMFTLILQCLAAGSQISLANGISLPIETLMENTKVMAWDEKTKSLIPANQSALLVQGVKDCVTLTLEDGKEITCTPNHRFLNSKGEWGEAQDIILNETELTMGVHQPCYDLSEKTNFKFIYDLHTFDGKMKAMALCRLLGYCSSIRELCFNNIIDARKVVNDIELLIGKRQKIKGYTTLKICIPIELKKIFNAVSPNQNKFHIPQFIFDKNCPKYLIKEFLAGLFGSEDELTPKIRRKNKLTSLTLVLSKENKFVPNLVDSVQELVKLLEQRFGIVSKPSKPDVYEKGRSDIFLSICNESDVKTFMEKIGVRYCCYKEHHITALLSYKNYCNSKPHKPDSLKKYLKRTGLDEFYNNYCLTSYPTYKLKVIGRKSAEKQKVYDLTVDKHHNFITNGIVSHNCNEPPKIPGNDEATWRRIRIMDYESSFVMPQDEEANIVPKKFSDQIKEKKFFADPSFDEKLPFLAPILLWKLFHHYVNVYSKLGLREPKEVIVSTNAYKTSNDIYQQFIAEYIEKVEDVEEARKAYIPEGEMYNNFKNWYNENHPSYSRSSINKTKMKYALEIRLGIKKSEDQLYGYTEKPSKRFCGYRIIMTEEDFNDVIGKKN